MAALPCIFIAAGFAGGLIRFCRRRGRPELFAGRAAPSFAPEAADMGTWVLGAAVAFALLYSGWAYLDQRRQEEVQLHALAEQRLEEARERQAALDRQAQELARQQEALRAAALRATPAPATPRPDAWMWDRHGTLDQPAQPARRR